jgi:hypothetical protein
VFELIISKPLKTQLYQMANIMNKFNNKQKQPQANRCEERNKERGKQRKR